MRSSRKSWLSTVFTLPLIFFLSILVAELTSQVFLSFNPEKKPLSIRDFRLTEKQRQRVARILQKKTEYNVFDSELGWTVSPSVSTRVRTSNRLAARSLREYSREVPEKVLRISTFGDSFTHCTEAKDNETWQYFLEQKHPMLEVLNFGVGGYGTDQALLRYRKKRNKVKSQVVVLGLMEENINRIENVFRPFYNHGTRIPMTKPRFRLVDGQLKLIKNPIQSSADYQELLQSPTTSLESFGENDFWYKRYWKPWPLEFLAVVKAFRKISEGRFPDLYQRKESLDLLVSIIRSFQEQVRRDGGHPVLLVFSTRRNLGTSNPKYAPILKALRGQPITIIETANAFERGWEIKEPDRFHHTAEENKIIADFLYRVLSKVLPRHLALAQRS